ncbi:MAG: HAD family hydrolase [Ruminococcaceae bacterium]|nr:HAD family hydrolase [Oscillospiraceae bacterium]
MSYAEKPEMILFDVGGTLFDDTKCIPIDGLRELRLRADNPEVTTDEILAELWDSYMEEIGSDIRSASGVKLDMPLSSVIKYITMNAGLHFSFDMYNQEEIFDRFNSERKVIDGVVSLLKTLDSLSIRTAVISNNAMSGESLSLAVNRWIPENKFEFFLTSADLLLTKPDKSLFVAAANYADVDAKDCWYCGDGRIPDVDGAKNSGMTPVLIDENSSQSFEWRADGGRGEYLAINHWCELEKYLLSL